MIAKETFWTLFYDSAHWEFELFLMLVFDVIIGYLGFKVAWPKIKAHFHSDLEHAGHDHDPHEEHYEVPEVFNEVKVMGTTRQGATVAERNQTLACIACGKQLESAFPTNLADGKNQPYAGTAFTSHGHYGSTVFDPMNSRDFLELNVCDACLTEAAKDGRVLRGNSYTRREITLGPWDPESEE